MAARAARHARLPTLLAERILVLDGAMGTMLQRAGLVEADYRGERLADHPSDLFGNHDLLALTRPDVLRGVHDAYLAAGADIVETSTFTATRIAQAEYGTAALVGDINREAARIARAAADAAETTERPRVTWPACWVRPRAPHRSRRRSMTPASATSPSPSW